MNGSNGGAGAGAGGVDIGGGLICYDITGRPMSALRRPDHVGLLGICQQGGSVALAEMNNNNINKQKRVRFNDVVSEVAPPSLTMVPTSSTTTTNSMKQNNLRSQSNTSLTNGLGPLWEAENQDNEIANGMNAANGSYPVTNRNATTPVASTYMSCSAQSRLENGPFDHNHHHSNNQQPQHLKQHPTQIVEVESRGNGADPPGGQLMKKTVRYSRHYQ